MASVSKLFEQANKAQQQGLVTEAVEGYRKVLKKKPNHGDAHYLLGTLLATQGQRKQALLHLQRASRLLPASPMVKTNLGLLLKMQDQPDTAEKAFRAALRIQPHQPEALNNLSALMITKGHPVEAEALARQCIVMGGEHARYGYIQCGNAVADQGRSDEAIELLHQALSYDRSNQAAWDNYLTLLSYSTQFDSEAIYQAHRRWAQQFEQPVPAKPAAVKGVIKIGYLSPDFTEHPVGKLMEPLLAHHDSEQFEIYLYHDSQRSDDLTARLKALGHHWRDVAAMDNTACQGLIADDGIHILIDLAGHSANNRLPMFAMRAAPIQVSYLGYSSTTGLENIDYAISDEMFDPIDPANENAFYSEKLLRLKRIAFAFMPASVAPPVNQDKQAGFTLGSFNTLRKIGADVIALWAEMLKKIPNSRLLLQTRGLDEPAMAEQLTAQFVALGVESTQLELHGFSDYQSHLALVAKCDLTLDPWPWNGHMTTLNTLWMGVPMLTLKTDRRSGRMGAAILQSLEMEYFIAESPQQYLEKALELSKEPEKLTTVRQTLRQRMTDSALVDGKGLAIAMEQAFCTMLKSNP